MINTNPTKFFVKCVLKTSGAKIYEEMELKPGFTDKLFVCYTDHTGGKFEMEMSKYWSNIINDIGTGGSAGKLINIGNTYIRTDDISVIQFGTK